MLAPSVGKFLASGNLRTALPRDRTKRTIQLIEWESEHLTDPRRRSSHKQKVTGRRERGKRVARGKLRQTEPRAFTPKKEFVVRTEASDRPGAKTGAASTRVPSRQTRHSSILSPNHKALSSPDTLVKSCIKQSLIPSNKVVKWQEILCLCPSAVVPLLAVSCGHVMRGISFLFIRIYARLQLFCPILCPIVFADYRV